MRFKKIKRSSFLLLEVMIAFSILAISAIPLIYPHLMILKEERALIDELNFDFYAKNLIGGLLVDLYENSVPFNVIEDRGTLEVTKEKMLNAKIPEGSLERAYYTFEQKHKPKGPATKKLYNVNARLHLIYSQSYKERLQKEEAVYPVSFNIERVFQEKGEENEKNKKNK